MLFFRTLIADLSTDPCFFGSVLKNESTDPRSVLFFGADLERIWVRILEIGPRSVLFIASDPSFFWGYSGTIALDPVLKYGFKSVINPKTVLDLSPYLFFLGLEFIRPIPLKYYLQSVRTGEYKNSNN